MANQEQLQAAEDIQFPHLTIETLIDDEEDEIPLQMLLDGPDSDQEVDQVIGNAANNVRNVGAVLLREEPFPNPVFLQKKYTSMDNCFSPGPSTLEKVSGKSVKVSAQWALFFTALLLSPANFKWAKIFI